MRTILVVDDSAEAREVAGTCLIEHGMTPLFAENGREAIELIEKHRPDAVLTDLHMPKMNGLELVEHLRDKRAGVPVVLMTSRGGERVAFAALKAGALSYVPKRELRGSLCDAMRTVVAAVEARERRDKFKAPQQDDESHFVLGYELEATTALVSHLQEKLERCRVCDETGVFQISTALGEAFSNAIDHGNLELDSTIRESGIERYEQLRQERSQQQPYRNRRVHVIEQMTTDAVTYIVRDEGRGFDVRAIPDPTDAENLLKASGRGLMLIRTFMDEVSFNDVGNEITMRKMLRNGGRSSVNE